MKISLYTATFDDTTDSRTYDLIKTLELDYLPQIGSSYIDMDDKKVYTISSIFFTDHNTNAVVKLQGEERFDNYVPML